MPTTSQAPVHERLIIVGSGPAGYTAAIYAARAMVEPLLISGFQPGGQLMITTDVENYPGFAEAIQGPWLMEQMRLQAEHVGTRIVSEYIAKVDLKQRPFRLEADSGAVWTCDALIIATGAQAKWLGLPSEAAFQGFGVSACATCDGFFFRGKEVVVVGGGNTAVEEALYLANLASKVTVVHRRDGFRAERILQERLFRHPNVEVVWNHAVEEICGTKTPAPSVTHLRLRDVRTGAITERRTDGVFIAIGHQPATGVFEGQLPLRSGGYLSVAPGTAQTEIPGVFAAGDVTDDVYRQAITAAGMGCMAALEAEKYLANLAIGESPRQAAAE
ncbi:thioredoxin-disulfide reductase [Methylobacterium oryzihabitans]|uniref:Thioredoxin reductase n=1 Tax=Methylobacterium oryzihabitans TaxID=2499852 RepID=A0A437P7T6_9HYPH|nr:thioredoxin-disulfide reductase [Methylobacterium oryzihabitans]RVU18158.1 thioredoxin-disulfide reductase [Methylobacterium oryzihabitans]